ncbi:hypothetical protein D3C78_1529480 [compost metagenome]
MARKQINASSRLEYSPELRQAHIQPAQVISITIPLIVPTVRFNFKVRRIGNNQVDAIIREGSDVLEAVSVD